MLDYEQVFGNAFERRESKYCGVLMKHRRKGKGGQLINLQMDQLLKTKSINVVPGQLFERSVKANFLSETDSLYDDQDKVQSVTDNDNKFNEFPCQTASKNLQSIHISPASLHAFMKALKSDISKPYKVQVDCFKIQSLILIIKMI